MRVGLSRFFAAVAVGLSIAASSVMPTQAQSVRITGSGASFPFPLYTTWFQTFGAQNRGIRIDYQSVGSGAGIQAFINRTVDFAASDAAMTDDQIKQVNGGAVLLPMTAGTIVLAYNLPGVKDLKLPREVYPLIFTGDVKKWNDPRIVAANPGVTMPDLGITVARRSDASGTTFVFTKHLSAISPAFKQAMGFGTTVQWPNLPNFVGAPRNDGVAATVMQTPGAIGYIEYGFAKLSKQPFAMLQNKAGKYVAADAETGAAALASADFSGDDLRVWVSDPDGDKSYPIATFTWMLFYKNLNKPEVTAGLRKMVEWAITDGQKMADPLGYVPLPEKVVARIRSEIPKIQ
ncbi:MAG TPA: phosphate ABC transporter substrate-binding protein PstS [Rhodoblastus sp.]|nr:phosphate ABC transporter substrate-binding protein PstS [Rhodoblastus sp.]